MRKRIVLAAAVFSCSSLAGVANADTISAQQLTAGKSSVTIGQTVVTAYNDYFADTGQPQSGKFAQKAMYSQATNQWVMGAGVSNSFLDPAEIDSLFGDKEAIAFDFSRWSAGGANISDLDVAFLFTRLQNLDLADEAAKFHVDFANGSSQDFTLTAVSPTKAVFSGNSTPTNLSPATWGNAGAWSVANPFGDGLVSKLILMAGTNRNDLQNWTSDYAFMGLTTLSDANVAAVPVPTPSAVWGGLGLMGLFGVVGWHRRSSQA
jgi:hypothetical protein